MQVPFEHTPCVHTCPQDPQFKRSDLRSTHDFLHFVWPEGQSGGLAANAAADGTATAAVAAPPTTATSRRNRRRDVESTTLRAARRAARSKSPTAIFPPSRQSRPKTTPNVAPASSDTRLANQGQTRLHQGRLHELIRRMEPALADAPTLRAYRAVITKWFR